MHQIVVKGAPKHPRSIPCFGQIRNDLYAAFCRRFYSDRRIATAMCDATRFVEPLYFCRKQMPMDGASWARRRDIRPKADCHYLPANMMIGRMNATLDFVLAHAWTWRAPRF